ncbi:MmcQ/YjbR family DNA-binding protein [Paludibaculum fermentans]|uniref:MmcQ/YjbR family DNA-binding protein n=1 Tax=Paludibaculum fermentans TaxID=1473598 RepID=UPI003EB79AA9
MECGAIAAQDFEVVRRIGLALPGVEALTKYDGSPVLKVGGVFVAGLALHPSAEPGTLVVRARLDERDLFVEEAPETYYLTDYYRSYPLVLVRLTQIREDALRDLLTVSWRMAKKKGKKTRRPDPL